MDRENFKGAIKALRLERYYDPMRRKCEMLHDEHSGYFDEMGQYVDNWNPDAYCIRIFYIEYKNVLYVGNEQIPIESEYNNKERTYNLIDYWFRGKNCNYDILYQYDRIHNKSISFRGYGCNQSILDLAKNELIESIKANLNVTNIGEMTSNDIKKMYGKNISLYKQKMRKNLKTNVTSDDFCRYVIMILEDIKSNVNKWGNMLYFKNRYWLISNMQEDIEDRESFFKDYEHVDETYINILIFLKEYLLWQYCRMMTRQQSIFDKINYIDNSKCKSLRLYDANNLFTDKKPIYIMLGLCYKNVFEETFHNQYKQFQEFKRNMYQQIYTK